ncbi:hypothetical protein PAXINDRAFT_99553 [Paxillus involutus ATCC 200175]|uniref:Uncharacterized protein n=1 Tax=Paxillus involutus ATCC 200175 TaxID=664439 RepID=A0A0C9TI11_PAXIN|nr:hypothetical protein PAXINDRAFT_99553 [Paxillus involutus ATCC 200175]
MTGSPRDPIGLQSFMTPACKTTVETLEWLTTVAYKDSEGVEAIDYVHDANLLNEPDPSARHPGPVIGLVKEAAKFYALNVTTFELSFYPVRSP